MRYVFKLSYDGTEYAGWQRQKNATSVQQKVEEALYTALGGNSANVAAASTIVDVLNEIAKLFSGDYDATLNAEAIDNITAVASVIHPTVTYQDKTVDPSTSSQE